MGMKTTLALYALIVLATMTHATLTMHKSYFIKGSYDETTMIYMDLPETQQPMSFIPCSFACLKVSNCTGFTFHGKHCNLTRYIPVKAIESSENKVDAWLSPLTKQGDVLDYSADETQSAPARFSLTWPKTARSGPFFLSSNKTFKALPIFDGSSKYYTWNIGESSTSLMDIENPSIETGMTAGWASMNDVMFVIGVGGSRDSAWGYVNSNWKKLKSFGKLIKFACVAFIPGKSDTAYFMGGSNDANLYAYSFPQDTYSVLFTHPDATVKINYLGCTAYKDVNGKEYYIRVGGMYGSSSDTNEVQKFCLNCGTPSWTPLPNYPSTITYPSVVEKNGILYSFGGDGGTAAPGNVKVYKLNLQSPQQWIQLGDLPATVKKNSLYVVPYGG